MRSMSAPNVSRGEIGEDWGLGRVGEGGIGEEGESEGGSSSMLLYASVGNEILGVF